MERSSNKQGNKVAPASFATELHLSRKPFNEAQRVRDALEAEAEMQVAMNNYEMARFLCDVSETLGEAGLVRICKAIDNGR